MRREISRHMQRLGSGLDEAIEEIAGRRLAFTLIVFSDTADVMASYISTASRAHNIEMFKDLTEQWEAGQPDIPAHEVN